MVMSIITLKVPEEMLADIELLANANNMTRSEFIRKAIEYYIYNSGMIDEDMKIRLKSGDYGSKKRIEILGVFPVAKHGYPIKVKLSEKYGKLERRVEPYVKIKIIDVFSIPKKQSG